MGRKLEPMRTAPEAARGASRSGLQVSLRLAIAPARVLLPLVERPHHQGYPGLGPPRRHRLLHRQVRCPLLLGQQASAGAHGLQPARCCSWTEFAASTSSMALASASSRTSTLGFSGGSGFVSIPDTTADCPGFLNGPGASSGREPGNRAAPARTRGWPRSCGRQRGTGRTAPTVVQASRALAPGARRDTVREERVMRHIRSLVSSWPWWPARPWAWLRAARPARAAVAPSRARTWTADGTPRQATTRRPTWTRGCLTPPSASPWPGTSAALPDRPGLRAAERDRVVLQHRQTP